MKRTIYCMLLFLIGCAGRIQAQGIRGNVINEQSLPIDGVAVILQTLDSTYVDAVVTDTLGNFQLDHPTDHRYRLLFQHLLYDTFEKEISVANIGMIILGEKKNQLSEVIVRGERPQVKLEGGTLSYDVPQLMKGKTATNAFEIIKDLPGIVAKDESVELVGANKLNIILNGQLTTMSTDQLLQLLRSMPASRVEKAEIMYNAPAKYNVKGALLNIILSKNDSEESSFQGEAGTEYIQRHYATGRAHANLLYSSKGFGFDFLVNGSKGRILMGEEMLARHTLNKKVTKIDQYNRGVSHFNRANIRIGVDYTLANKDKLSLSYYLEGSKPNTNRTSTTSYTNLSAPDDTSISTSEITGQDRSATHNIRLQYDGHKGLTAGTDFTHFHSPSEQRYLDNNNTSGSNTDMINNTRQDISRWTAFIDQTHDFASGWNLNYGVNGRFATSTNYLEYLYDRGNGYEIDWDVFEDNTQKEYNVDLFAEVSKSFGEHFSATVGLKGEYFKSDYQSTKENMNLWKDWTLFPTASLSYTISPRHILQLNVSSEKIYPGYWELSPQKQPLNSYSEIVGNPLLKPYRSYEGQLVYILRQKYMLIAFCEYTPDYFVQLPYQSDTELKNVFNWVNMDYSMEAGLAVIVPFKVGDFWDSQITLRGWRMQEKNSDFFGMSYNREAYLGLAQMTNTFNLSDQPNLKLTIDGQYVTPGAIQGIYD